MINEVDTDMLGVSTVGSSIVLTRRSGIVRCRERNELYVGRTEDRGLSISYPNDVAIVVKLMSLCIVSVSLVSRNLGEYLELRVDIN
jgi:hypothetical protein